MWVSTRGEALRDSLGSVIGLRGTIEEVTDRRKAEEMLLRLVEGERAARTEAERRGRGKDEFLAAVSHELRTPLNAILGWTQLLNADSTDPASVRDGIRIIERSARAQAGLIADLLDMSRIIAGNLTLSLSDVDLREVIAKVVEAVRPSADLKGVHISSAVDTAVGPIRGDADRLRQVVWNLLRNAVKFT